MTTDPLRDQLAANLDAPRDSVDWERADEAYRDYVEAKARGELSGPQPPAEDAAQHIRNALQLLVPQTHESEQHACWCKVVEGATVDAIRARLEKALAQLEGSPLRAPQED